MSRTPLLIGVALLAVAAVSVGGAGSVVGSNDAAGALPGQEPVRVETAPNTTNYLVPDENVERRTYQTANVDVGSAVAASASRLDGEFRARTYDEQLTSQPTGEQRLGVAERTLNDAETRMQRLDAEQEALFRAYSNGTLSRQQFVRHLVRLDVRATAYSNYIDAFEQRTEDRLDETRPPNFETRLSRLRSQTVVLPDPVAARTTRAVLGFAGSFTLYAEGVDDALVLASVDDGEFHRQATLRDAYRPAEANTLGLDGALQRATELYPWVYSGGQGFKPQIGIAGSGLFRIRADHPQGTLVSYIGGSTSDVFHESQTLDPDTVPVYKTATNETASLNLTVTTTKQTGPMRVALTTPAGIPVNGTVLVDGEPVGTTGQDGALWLVRPSGTFQLTAINESGQEASLSRIRFLRSS